MSDGKAEYGLVMPFVGVSSVGGPYDDNAFVAGYETGSLDARLQYEHPDTLALTVHSMNLPQIDLVAMHRGYQLEEGLADDEWASITLHRNP